MFHFDSDYNPQDLKFTQLNKALTGQGAKKVFVSIKSETVNYHTRIFAWYNFSDRSFVVLKASPETGEFIFSGCEWIPGFGH